MTKEDYLEWVNNNAEELMLEFVDKYVDEWDEFTYKKYCEEKN